MIQIFNNFDKNFEIKQTKSYYKNLLITKNEIVIEKDIPKKISTKLSLIYTKNFDLCFFPENILILAKDKYCPVPSICNYEESKTKKFIITFLNKTEDKIIIPKNTNIGRIYFCYSANGTLDENFISNEIIYKSDKLGIISFDHIKRDYTIVTEDNKPTELHIVLD